MPHANDDLLGWQAHYPSDTWRIQHRQGAVGDHKPIKRGWWSAREATPRFPNRLVRHRLLPVPDEASTSALMLSGGPQRVYARLEMVPKSPAETTIIAEETTLGESVRTITLADVHVLRKPIQPEPIRRRAGYGCYQRLGRMDRDHTSSRDQTERTSPYPTCARCSSVSPGIRARAFAGVLRQIPPRWTAWFSSSPG